ncbi:uncharacterized protein LOC133229507 [Bos javanicus]|uniref:uncharacterized protein LOC133229507 n=1 Tax=Bos javanicus TaxID=9906 RepID=UPI002AA943D5|nr:uncharacterized protein LOC133229507 [Bos javanicus]
MGTVKTEARGSKIPTYHPDDGKQGALPVGAAAVETLSDVLWDGLNPCTETEEAYADSENKLMVVGERMEGDDTGNDYSKSLTVLNPTYKTTFPSGPGAPPYLGLLSRHREAGVGEARCLLGLVVRWAALGALRSRFEFRPPAFGSETRQTVRASGSTCGAMMLPLSTIEGQETEEVQTRPPEKGALPSENPDDLLNKEEGKMSAKFLPICPLPSVCFAYYLETDDSDSDSQSDPDTSKPGLSCSSPSKPGVDHEEIQAWECPLCCLSILCLS